MYIVKILGLDHRTVVYFLPYMSQLVLAIINDYFIWKLGKTYIGVDGTRVAVFLIAVNHF